MITYTYGTMYPPVVCFCGRELGCLYDIFLALRTEKYVAEFGDLFIDPSIIPLTNDMQIEIADIFEKLNLRLDCCRAHIMAWVEFKELN